MAFGPSHVFCGFPHVLKRRFPSFWDLFSSFPPGSPAAGHCLWVACSLHSAIPGDPPFPECRTRGLSPGGCVQAAPLCQAVPSTGVLVPPPVPHSSCRLASWGAPFAGHLRLSCIWCCIQSLPLFSFKSETCPHPTVPISPFSSETTQHSAALTAQAPAGSGQGQGCLSLHWNLDLWSCHWGLVFPPQGSHFCCTLRGPQCSGICSWPAQQRPSRAGVPVGPSSREGCVCPQCPGHTGQAPTPALRVCSPARARGCFCE